MTSRASLCLALVVGACTGKSAEVSKDLPPPTPPPATSEPGPAPVRVFAPVRVQATATVLERSGGGPQLCLGDVMESLPPQCGGPPIVGWDWAAIEGEQRAGDTTWGEFHVVGDFDGRMFTLAGPPGPPQRAAPWVSTTPCARPAGGWERPDLGRASFAALEATQRAVQGMPGFVGMWLHDPEPPTDGAQDMTKVVLNVAFTGDAAGHTAALRERWGGALCVVQRGHSGAELARIQGAAQATVEELGLEWTSSGVDERRGVVEIAVLYADAAAQAEVDRRHGAGVVVLTSRLRPVPQEQPQARAGQPCTDGESLGDGCVCEDRQCMDICCVGSACSHHTSPEGGYAKCIRLPKKKRGE